MERVKECEEMRRKDRDAALASSCQFDESAITSAPFYMKPIRSGPTGPRPIVEHGSSPRERCCVRHRPPALRTAGWILDEVRIANPGYFCAPVPLLGPRCIARHRRAAPGMTAPTRAAVRSATTTRTCSATLHKFGFASKLTSAGVDDGLASSARITNVKCLPPQTSRCLPKSATATIFRRGPGARRRAARFSRSAP